MDPARSNLFSCFSLYSESHAKSHNPSQLRSIVDIFVTNSPKGVNTQPKTLLRENETTFLTKQQLADRLQLTPRGIECLVAARKIPVCESPHDVCVLVGPRVLAALSKFELKEIH